MRLVDVANVLAPGLPHRTVGIRPGEKLHEMMISGDDARMTTELTDRYVIEPAFVEYLRTPFSVAEGKGAPDGFVYASDSNREWLDADGLKALLAGHG
jgi:UDP-N-acetylglucosamine 4,6-dehydratase